MKFKNFLIIFCIVILATLSAVSASEDMSLENLTAIDNNEESIELVENADLTQDVQEATNEDINEDYDGNLKLEEGCDESLSDPDSSFENNVYIPESIDLGHNYPLVEISNLPSDLEGNISIKLNDVEIYNKHPNEDYLDIFLEDNLNLNIGCNTVEVSYFGGNYKEFSIIRNVNINYMFDGMVSDFGGLNLVIFVNLPNDAKSGINVKVNNKTFYANGRIIRISKYDCLLGLNNITLSYSDSKYPLKIFSFNYFLAPSIILEEEVVGEEEISGLVVIPYSEGVLSVSKPVFGEDSYTEEEVISNLTCYNTTLFKFKNDQVPTSYYYLKFESKNFTFTQNYEVHWSESEDNLEVNFTKNLKYGEEFKLKIHNPSNEYIYLNIYWDSLYTIDYDSIIIREYPISNNVSISIPNLKVGNHTIVIKSRYSGYYKICNFTVEPNEAISNNTELINNTSSNEIINNKSVSDKTNTNTVKSLVLKKIKIKRSASKLTLSATLKINKKAIRGKVITFKFNGKTFKAKTNSKGIAKVTVKKSYFKKIKIGKKVKYQAQYGKIRVTKTAKVTR